MKDLISKGNRNQAFTYDIDSTHKLASVAAQQRYEKSSPLCLFFYHESLWQFSVCVVCSFDKDTYVGRNADLMRALHMVQKLLELTE